MDVETVEGVWALVSLEREFDDGRCDLPLGDQPKGVIAYQAGRMSCVLTSSEREPVGLDLGEPAGEAARVAAFRSCYAYAGTYEVVDGNLVHHVDVSLIPEWDGTEQVRVVRQEGDRMHLTSRLDEGTVQASTNRLVWRRAAPGERLGIAP